MPPSNLAWKRPSNHTAN